MKTTPVRTWHRVDANVLPIRSAITGRVEWAAYIELRHRAIRTSYQIGIAPTKGDALAELHRQLANALEDVRERLLRQASKVNADAAYRRRRRRPRPRVVRKAAKKK